MARKTSIFTTNIVQGQDIITEKIVSKNGNVSIDIVDTGDDKGVNIKGGQFSVGNPGDGKETVLGAGDSYPVPYAFHCHTANISGDIITDAIDVSPILQSDDNSTTTLFGGLTAGSFALIGSDYKYAGVKAKIHTGATLDNSKYDAYYVNGSLTNTIISPYMATDANQPYNQRANKIATLSGISEQWRFGFNPLDFPIDWDKASLTINGVVFEKYWSIMALSADITEQPIIEQIKMHTDRWECNADGITEYYGRARYIKSLLMHWHLTEELNGFVPKNRTITVADGLGLKYSGNKLEATAKDGKGSYIIIPVGLDTSIPIVIDVLWTPLNNDAGNIYSTYAYISKKIGSVLDDTLSPITNGFENPIALNSLNKLHKTQLVIPVETLIPGELLFFSIMRDGTNVLDTYSGAAALVSINATGTFWKP